MTKLKNALQRVILLLLIINYYSAQATTYTFIGSGDLEGGNPLYTNVANWENNSYPGFTINAADTVIVNGYCVTPNNNLIVNGYLEANDRIDGSEIRVMASGHLRVGLSSSIGNPVRSSGIISGTGTLATVLNCESCTLYPGQKDEYGAIRIETLLVSGDATIEIDVIGQHTYDLIIGNTAIITEGTLVLNYIKPNQRPENYESYNVFQFKVEEELGFTTLAAYPFQSLQVGVTSSERIFVTEPFQGDRALHFDGENDYGSSTANIGLVRTIEFRITPDRIGASEEGQMILNPNLELLRYIIINKTTSAFENETLSIKNGAGLGLNWRYTTYAFESGETYHITIVANAQDRYDKIYVNGEEVVSMTGTELPPLFDIRSFDIGTRNNAFHYKGKLDEIRMWSAVRTLQQIQNNWNGYLDVADTSNLLLHYNFDQGRPYEDNACLDFIIDEVGANDGRLSNFTLDNTVFNNANNSNWVYAGCRRLLTTDDGASNWHDSYSWRPVAIPSSQCHDVLIDGVEGPSLPVDEFSQAECISLEVSPNQTFIVNSGATLEVTEK